MDNLLRDIERNRAMMRHSHARLMAKSEALLALADVAGAKTCSPLWHAGIVLGVAVDAARAAEDEAARLLERASTILEEAKP